MCFLGYDFKFTGMELVVWQLRIAVVGSRPS